MKVRVLAVLAALVPMVLGGAAQAEDCKPLHLATQIQLDMSHGVPIMPVNINGTPRRFLFDTGGGLAQISPSVVKELSLRTRVSPLKTFDAGGNISSRMAYADSFEMGSLKVQNVQFQVATSSFGGEIDGSMAPASLAALDIDMDFGPGRLAYFLQDHCPGRVVYWKADAVAVVPITIQDLHLTVPIILDGKPFKAVIDTGSSGSLMDMAVARRVFDLSPESPGMTAEGHANGDLNLPIYGHTFGSLSFEGVTITNPRIGLIPDRVASKDRDNDFQTGSHVKRHDDDIINLPKVTIGMNILKKMHIYIAYKERNLYITPAGAPDAPSPFGAPAK